MPLSAIEHVRAVGGSAPAASARRARLAMEQPQGRVCVRGAEAAQMPPASSATCTRHGRATGGASARRSHRVSAHVAWRERALTRASSSAHATRPRTERRCERIPLRIGNGPALCARPRERLLQHSLAVALRPATLAREPRRPALRGRRPCDPRARVNPARGRSRSRAACWRTAQRRLLEAAAARAPRSSRDCPPARRRRVLRRPPRCWQAPAPPGGASGPAGERRAMARGTRHEHTWVARHATLARQVHAIVRARTPSRTLTPSARSSLATACAVKPPASLTMCALGAPRGSSARARRARARRPTRVDQRHGNAVCCLRPRKRHGAHAALAAPARRHARRASGPSARRLSPRPRPTRARRRGAAPGGIERPPRASSRAERRDAHRSNHAATTACTREERRRAAHTHRRRPPRARQSHAADAAGGAPAPGSRARGGEACGSTAPWVARRAPSRDTTSPWTRRASSPGRAPPARGTERAARRWRERRGRAAADRRRGGRARAPGRLAAAPAARGTASLPMQLPSQGAGRATGAPRGQRARRPLASPGRAAAGAGARGQLATAVAPGRAPARRAAGATR